MIDANDFLHIPAYWDNRMSSEEWDLALENMVQRTFLTKAFIDGEITPDQFGDVLNETGVDVIQVANLWDEGLYIP
jgi:peptide subunit release factor RF-3